jgi:surface antigen
MRRWNFCLIVLAMILVPVTASAAGWGALLLQGPTSWFNGDDMKLFVDSAREALDKAPVGKPVTWRNPKTNNSGSATILATSEKDGQTCKTIKVDTQAKGATETMRYIACREPDGRWGLSVAQ